MTEEEKLLEKLRILEYEIGVREYVLKRREEKLEAEIAAAEAAKKGFWKWSHYRCSCPVRDGKKYCKKICLCSKPPKRCMCKQWVNYKKEDPALPIQAPPTPAVIGKRKIWIA